MMSSPDPPRRHSSASDAFLGCGCSLVALFGGIFAGVLAVGVLGVASVRVTDDSAFVIVVGSGVLCVAAAWASMAFDSDRLLGAVMGVIGIGLAVAGLFAWPLIPVGLLVAYAGFGMLTEPADKTSDT